ncbi:putative kinesin [Bimuria novae-zelandiae CBS 107.79]|uniref:Putative kinesin n=1 Tax=Bimuria novae-zelandiae CBS 107.79 TaxID=1447943 RepID=A0A6A5UZJ1_9PLEO|nr:putative kinesin [Bimuria novae-zelandiae CBS 107.79]
MASTTFGRANVGFQAGTINGPVHTTFHAPPKRRETPPQPSIVIPFAHDADFVDRGTLLDEICERCTQPNARIALVGLGGVGKSQLAIEYAYRTREQSPETWVLWAHASNAARLEQSFRDIADRVKIAGRQDPQINMFKLVHDWLCDSKQPWLLVLDNVDDASFLLDAESASSQTAARPLREYLPHCEHGSMLITSRSKEAARKLVEQRDIIRLEPMDEAQSQALLARKLGAPVDNSSDIELAELAAALEYMPLAIVQAAAYISQKAPLCSVAQYLDQLRKSERKRTSLLNRDEGQLRRDREAKNSIIATWQISFEHIQQTRPSAADLLSLMSFFDRQGIPRGLLQLQAKHDKDHSVDESSNDDSFEDDSLEDDAFSDDVTVLRNFCFVSANTEGTSFEMHALVQLSMRTWLSTNGKLEQWKQHFISNLYAAFPTGEYENWAKCQALFAHAKASASQKPEAASSLIEWATLLYRAAWYAESKGSAGEAETLAIQSMKVRKTVLGREHQDTVRSIAMVADAYSLGGRWDEAEKLREQGGRWDAAEELFVQVMETRKKKLGADHPSTLTSMHNLAWTWKSLERSAEAISLLQECVRLRCLALRAGHPDLVSSSKTLAAWEAEQAASTISKRS